MVSIKDNEIKHFNFNIEVKGAEVKSTSARLVFEGQGTSKMFPVNIDDDGIFRHAVKYSEIRDLREGKVYLEVLADKNYFKPWEDRYVVLGAYSPIKESTQKETAKPVEKKIIKESIQPIVDEKLKPTYKELRKEYKSFLKKKGVSFLDGDTPQNVQIKRRVLSLMEQKYGKMVKLELQKLNSIKIDELLIY